MAKRKIAVAPLWDDEKESIWMLPGYLDGIRDAGGIPVILPLSSTPEDVLEIFELCDGLLMTGGHDVSPALYHQEKKESCGQTCAARDRIERVLYENALANEKPVLGICRGIQLINVWKCPLAAHRRQVAPQNRNAARLGGAPARRYALSGSAYRIWKFN